VAWVAPDARHCFLGGEGSTVVKLELASERCVTVMRAGRSEPIHAIGASNRRVLAAGASSRVFEFDLDSGEFLRSWSAGLPCTLCAIWWLPDEYCKTPGTVFAVATDGTVLSFEPGITANEKGCLNVRKMHPETTGTTTRSVVVNDVWVDRTGQFVYNAGNDETIVVWDLIGQPWRQLALVRPEKSKVVEVSATMSFEDVEYHYERVQGAAHDLPLAHAPYRGSKLEPDQIGRMHVSPPQGLVPPPW